MAEAQTSQYLLGTSLSQFGEGRAKQLVFVVTQNCNLACRYCYVTHKNASGKMTFEVARDAVDFFLAQRFPNPSVVWSFTGGEPLLETSLLDELCDYIKVRTYVLKHPWMDRYRIMVGTNGVLYGDQRFQRFLKKHREHVAVSITIDGTQLKHDLNRVYPDGRGSYSDIIENVKLWIRQFPEETTKVTFASGDLPYLRDSIVHLWNLGVRSIPANVVFEDVWGDGDDAVLEEQMIALADYVLDNKLWNEVQCTLFGDSIGFPLLEEERRKNWCGAGLMLAVDHQGLLYPCQRFMPFSLDNREGYAVGDIYRGINEDRLRPFVALDLVSQSRAECVECPVASGCAWCQGYNYDIAATPTLYERATHICRMHKARVRANEYYWARLRHAAGMGRPVSTAERRRRHLLILASEDAVVHCAYNRPGQGRGRLSQQALERGLDFARRHFYRPIVLQPEAGPRLDLPQEWDPIDLVSAQSKYVTESDLVVFNNEVPVGAHCDNSILIVDCANIELLSGLVGDLWNRARRINLVLRGLEAMDERLLAKYESQLRAVAGDLLFRMARGDNHEVSALTDRLHLKEPEDCGAGLNALTLAPNGRFYLCPAFYYTEQTESIGSPDEGVNEAVVGLCDRRKAPLCRSCGAYQCKRCVFDNHQRTLSHGVPSRIQCVVGHTELKVAAWFRQEALEKLGYRSNAPEIDLTTPLDPLESVPMWSLVYSKPAAEVNQV